MIRRVTLGALVLLICALPGSAQTTCNKFLYDPNGGDSIGVHCDSNVLTCTDSVDGAAAMWNGCGQSGTGSPAIEANGSGDIDVSVEIRDANSNLSGGGCAVFQPTVSGNRVTGGHVIVYSRRSDGSSCLPYDKTIAHEIGHALGFDDSSCNDGRIMSGRSAQGDYREVKADECSAADSRWSTTSETSSGGGGGGDQDDWCGAFPDFCNCPLILDLNGDGLRTTDLSSPVLFDLNADGALEILAWTDPTGEEAFLWIDMVPNGRVDDGAELFGVGTFLPSGARAPNGFAALAAYDEPAQGGDGDGRITSGDAIWAKLRLWIDANHNGLSEPSEVGPIHRYGVTELNLAYTVDRDVDSSGNHHFLRGTYVRQTPSHEMNVHALDDVFFRRQP